MADGQVIIQIGADVSDFHAGVDKAKSGLGGLVDGLGKLGLAGMGFSVLKDGIGSVIGPAAEFGAKIAEIKAVSGATGPELAKLHDLALELGAATDVGSVSASDAADAISVLSKAGVTAQDQMAGVTRSVLQLAAAAGPEFGVAKSAELASDAMAVFGIAAKDSKNVVDTLVGAANASTIGLEDMKYSMSAAGVAAATVGMNFKDTATAIAVFGQNGLKGSDAGTSLKSMLMHLQPQTKAQTKAMLDLGIVTKDGSNAFFDANGKIKSLAAVSGILQDALGGLSEQQKFATLQTIFGSDAIRAASILTKEGAAGIGEMSAAMEKQGNAAATAATMSDNLKGKWEAFQGTIETLQISIGEKLAPALSQIVDWANNLLGGSMGQLPDLFGFFGSVLEQLQPVFQMVWNFATALADAWLSAAAVFQSTGSIWEALGELVGRTFEAIKEVAIKVVTWIADTGLPWLVQKLGEWGAAFVAWIGPKIPPMLQELGKLLVAGVTWMAGTGLPALVSKLVEWGNAFVAWVGPKIPPMLAEMARLLSRLLNWMVSVALPAVAEKLLEWGRAFINWVAPAEVQMHVEFGKMLQNMLNWMVTQALPQILTALDQWGNAFINWIAKDVLPNLPGMLKAILDQIMGWGNDMDVAVGKKMSQVGGDLVAGLKRGIQNAWNAFISWLSGLVDSLPQIVKDILGIKSPSTVFAEIGQNMMMGWALGISKGVGLVQGAMGDVAGGLPALAGGGVGVPTLPAYGTINGGGGGGFGFNGGGGGGTNPLVVNVHFGAERASQTLATRQRLSTPRSLRYAR